MLGARTRGSRTRSGWPLLAAAALAGSVAGCSNGDSTSSSGGDADAATAADTGRSDGAGGPAADGGGTPGGDVPEGGAPVTPHEIACGAATCDSRASTCCALPDGGGACADGSGATCPTGSAALHCLAASDCNAGEVCCGAVDFTTTSVSTTCAATCTGFQFCETTSECQKGDPCVVQSCLGRRVELCGKQGFCQ